mgnify:CR=1 FL=1|jgi:hypothetical protein
MLLSRSERLLLKDRVLTHHRDWAALHATLKEKHRLTISQSSLDRYFGCRSNSARTLRTLAILLGTTPDELVHRLQAATSAETSTRPPKRTRTIVARPLRDPDAFRIAYQLWVEMTTRKLGLRIDLSQDLVVECYDSWYAFLKAARELTKAIPLHKDPRSPELRRLVQLSHSVMNEGVRPHLQRWQARFRAWLANGGDRARGAGLTPQEAQQLFPEWPALRDDLMASNQRLIGYLTALEIMVDRPTRVTRIIRETRKSA